MQALVYDAYGSLEGLRLAELAAPTARRGELVVDVHRAALNPKDSFVRKGRFAAVTGRAFPKRCGLDFAGVVRESATPRFSPGQRVFGALNEWTFQRGTLAEQLVISEDEATLVPEGVAEEDGAAIALTGLTALQALRDLGRVTRGTRVWVHGASGGVGTAAIQIARLLGAEVTTSSSAENLGLCEELGARRALDRAAPVVPELRGVIDVVFDVFGNLDPKVVAPVFADRGVFISTVPSARRAVLEVATRWSRRQTRLVVVRSRAADLAQLGAWLASRDLRAVIDSRFPLAKAKDAFRVLESKRTRGKIVVEIATPT